MASCLIVSSQEKSTKALVQVIRSRTVNMIATAKSSNEARRMIQNQNYDFVVINAPLSDEFGYDLAYHLTSTTDMGVVILIKNDIFKEMYEKLLQYGAICIGKPFDRLMLLQGIHIALSLHNRLSGMHIEKVKLEAKVEEIKTIDKAKYILIEYLNMSESDAHHYIEKQAMDKRTNKITIAKQILKTYE